eukprot:9076432-Pyramimonas_sp.AAC.1
MKTWELFGAMSLTAKSAGWQVLFNRDSSKDAEQSEEDWLELEKRVIVISRLHQILEPFMLRRMVEDVEKKLPPKVRKKLSRRRSRRFYRPCSHPSNQNRAGTITCEARPYLKKSAATLAFTLAVTTSVRH